ncbi:MAG: 16S rRNA (guanine(966)-N(2))-methyltransferase RsmD [Acidobacteriota bacterium]|jgi:16S rRNA (guanine(966)-N(2))-methyltransferase RsmD|nr:16S rRNA (guanine(966)-N(2))-methyltransferase RsmD [Acidobacteriota bacterium]
MLRIFSGLYKGRKLRSVKHPDVRPTTARVKLAFFDAMQAEVRQAVFLDGFAGVGNIGIEALSRGARYVVFIEELRECVKALRHNLEKIGVPPDCYRIINGDYNRSVIQLAKDGFQFDLVFLDPPYGLLEYADPVKVAAKRGLLAPGGRVILERPALIDFTSRWLERVHSQKVGNRRLDYYARAALSEDGSSPSEDGSRPDSSKMD